MSLEDMFHKCKSGAMLRARLTVSKEKFSDLRTNLESERTKRIIRRIEELNGFKVSFSDVWDRTSNTFRLKSEPSSGVLYVDVNHSHVGGGVFFRFVESLLGVAPRTLPANDLLLGVFYTIKFIRLWYFLCFTLQPVKRTGPMVHMQKAFTMNTDERSSRRFCAYHCMLTDALKSMGTRSINVGFTVAFEGWDVINNIGIVPLRFEEGMSVDELQRHFEARAPFALSSNTVSLLLGKVLHMLGADGGSMRERLDLICTSMVVDAPGYDVDLTVCPAFHVFEGAYVTLVSFLSAGSMRVVCSSTTNGDSKGWLEQGWKEAPREAMYDTELAPDRALSGIEEMD